MITEHTERLFDCLEELKPLFVPHYAELGLDQDKVALDPDYEIYLQREARGEVLCVTLREAGRIIAYFVGFIAPALHYKRCLTLQEDIFWLDPEYRHGDSLTQIEADMLCLKLFERVKTEAQRRGVQRVYLGSKWHRDASRLFEAIGVTQKADLYLSGWWGT